MRSSARVVLIVALAAAACEHGGAGASHDGGSDRSEPHSLVLEGTVTLREYAGGPRTREEPLRFVIWWPAGRVAGREALLSFESAWPQPGIAVVRAAVDADGGVAFAIRGLYIGATEVLAADVVVPGGSDCAAVRFDEWNLAAAGTDRGHLFTGTTEICPVPGAVPAADLRAWGLGLAHPPIGELTLAATAPIDPTTLHVVVIADGAPVPATARVETAAIVIEPETAFPPGAALAFDVIGTRDVLGRQLALARLPMPLRTTATVVDATLEAAPPAGALAGSATWTEGAIVLESEAALIALGDSPGTRVAIEGSVTCHETTQEAALVAADGGTRELALGCGPLSLVVERPGSGALWLAYRNPRLHPPQSTPLAYGRVAVTEIRFE